MVRLGGWKEPSTDVLGEALIFSDCRNNGMITSPNGLYSPSRFFSLWVAKYGNTGVGARSLADVLGEVLISLYPV